MKDIPTWDSDGNPQNLAAAAMDAVEWLKMFDHQFSWERLHEKSKFERGKLAAAIQEIEARVQNPIK